MDNRRSLIGRRIRERRKLAAMSQAELGRKLGYSHSAISRIELGIATLEIRDLERLASALGEPLEYLIEDLDPPVTGEGDEARSGLSQGGHE